MQRQFVSRNSWRYIGVGSRSRVRQLCNTEFKFTDFHRGGGRRYVGCCWFYSEWRVKYIYTNTADLVSWTGQQQFNTFIRTLSMVLGAFAKLRKATISFVMSVCPSSSNTSAPNGRILIKFYIWNFFENLSRKLKSDKNNGYFIRRLFHVYDKTWLNST